MNTEKLVKKVNKHDDDIVKVNEQLDNKANKNEIANGLTAKGNISYYNLPVAGNSIGDYYYCNDGDSENGSGNYVWNGTSWYFGGTGDDGYSRLRNDAFDVIYGTNLWEPSNVIENAWVLLDGTVQSPSPYGDGTFVYSGSISGGKTLYITYQSGETRPVFEISRYVIQDKNGNVLASGGSTLVNGLAIPEGATTIKILANTPSLSTLLQMEYDKISPYEEYSQPHYKVKTDTETVKNIAKEEIKNINIYNDNSYFFTPSKIYMYSGIIRYADKMNIIASNNESGYYLETPQNDPSRGYADKIGVIYGVDKIKVKRKNDGFIAYEKALEINKIDPKSKPNPTTTKNIMMIGDSYTGNNILPCDIKNQLVNVHGKTNYSFVGSKTSNIDGVTCNHEGRVGYSVADYIKTDNTQGRGTTFPNPYLKNGKVSIKTYCNDNAIPLPNIFIVELGINDIENGLQNSLNTNIKTLIDLIHAEFPNAKILLVGVVYASKINAEASYVEKNKKRMISNAYYETLSLNSDYKNFLKYVDVGFLFNTEYGYDFEQVAPYRGSSVTTPKIKDWLHPCKSGYYMESDCIVPALLSWNIS